MNEPDIELCVSFDYEVFLGENFKDEEEVLFEPTRRLLALCRELALPVTFFGDVCSVWAYRDQGLEGYAGEFERQLRLCVREGHDVQLHLHPHWMAAVRDGDRWIHRPDRLYLEEFGFGPEEGSSTGLIRRGVGYLEGLLRPVDPGYRCIAFRAPGLVLQPREADLLGALIDAGIVIDSSIAKGVRVVTEDVAFDYRGMPPAANWRMSRASGLTEDESGELLEVPIATFSMNRMRRLAFLVRRALSVGKRRGAGITREASPSRLRRLSGLIARNLHYLEATPVFILSSDTKGFDREMLLDGLSAYTEEHRGCARIVTSMLNHPKLMFEGQFALLREFVEGARGRFGDRLKFTTFQTVAGNALGRA